MAEELFADKHRVELIQRVENISPILDGLLSYDVINEESYDEIMSIPNSQEKMRALFSGPLQSSGVQGKEIFYKILSKNEPYLIEELKRTEYKNVVDKVQVETMTAKKMLFETLNDLSSEELEGFKSLIELEKGFSLISRRRLKEANTQDIVELMVETYSQECVELTKKVLKKMNRTDLVQRLSDISSGTKEKHSVDEQRPALIQRVETMASVIELLLETLADLSDGELKKFKVILGQIHFHSSFSDFPLLPLETTDMQDTVFFMVETYGQQSVEKTKEVLKTMKRTDLVQRLSDSSSGPKKKHSVDEHLSALIHKVATMAAVKELLLETLKDLSYRERQKFKCLLQFTFFQMSLPNISRTRLQMTYSAYLLVDFMVEVCGQQSVEVIMEVFMDMNRTDLVQRLSETSSGLKAAGSSAEVFCVNTTEGEKHSVDEHWPALIQEVETMASVTELLLETLADLSDGELKKFKEVILGQIHFHRRFPGFLLLPLETTDMQDTVFLMVEAYGHQSVEKTKEVLKMMKRTDLVQRLSDSSSGPKKKHSADEHRSALIHKVATKAAVKQLILETLKVLNKEEFDQFKEFLQLSFYQKDLSDTFWMLGQSTHRADTVDLMVQTYGQQSLEVTREVLKKMNRTDLVQRWSKSSSEKHRPALFESVPAMAAVEQILSETLKDLSYKEHEKFQWLLRFKCFQKSLPQIQWTQLKWEKTAELLVNLMVKSHGQQSVEVTKEVFMDMNRTDLVQRLSESSSGLKEKHPSKLLQKEVTMTSLQQKLLETLKDFSYGEFEYFKWLLQHTEMKKGLPTIARPRMEMADRAEIVELMVEIYGQQSEEVTREVLKKMNRTDLVQRLLDISSGSKEKHSVDEQRPALIQRVETMVSVIELLLETLADLSDGELKKFKEVILGQIHFHRRFSGFSLLPLETTDIQVTMFFMVETYGQQSVEKTKKVLKTMKRTDLVQKLSHSSSGPKKKHSVDEHLSALIHKVATMAAVKELLLETLKDLSYRERQKFKCLLQFTFFQRSLPNISRTRLQMTYSAYLLVDLMVEVCGQQSVEVIMEVFMDMNRTDLVQRLSETSSGLKAAGSSAEVFGVNTTEGEKHSVDERWPALIQEVEMMASVIELLLETLADLSDGELDTFEEVLRGQIHFHRHFPSMLLETTDMQDTVFFMVEAYGDQSVEKTKEVLKMMKRTDLVQRLSDSSSGPKKKHSADEHRSALIHKVATKAAVKQRILETLKVLSDEEFKRFKEFLQLSFYQKDLRDIWMLRQSALKQSAHRADTVELMMQTYGQQSLEVTREVLKKMNRTDLVQRWSKSSSEKHRPALFESVPAMAAVEQILSETLKDLSYKEREKFQWLLHFKCFQKSIPQISWTQLKWEKTAELLVNLMVQSNGQQSVEVTKEVFMDMNRTDLVERLSESSSGLKEKHPSEPFRKEVTMTPLKEKLLKTLEYFSYGEFEQFKWLLQHTEMKKGLPTIPRRRMEMGDRAEIVELMVEIYGQQSEEVTREVLKKMNRTDLVQRLSDISSGSKGPSRSLELEGCGSFMQDSSDWTKLEPEVNSTDADEAPTYSLQSEAGNFECSVSGLRWVCKEKVSFKHQFCSWEDPMERMESLKYMPAGPLMDITVIAGKLFEVYLPHWICIDDNPEILDKFAVLHIEDCGDVVEKVSEVTPSHVKLSEPIFSPRGVLLFLKSVFSGEISCNVLIYYKPNTPFLKLHVYLIPHDPALQQAVDKKKLSTGYKIIQKPRPDKYLKMKHGFILTADMDTAKIIPKKITLRYDSQDPNFYEVFIENPDRNFHLTLSHHNTNNGEPQCEPVWTCEIRKDDYQNSGHLEEKQSVDEHLSALMQKTATITTDRERLLETLEHLKQEELKEFKWHLQDNDIWAGLPCMPGSRLEKVDMLDLVDLMLQTYEQQSVEVTKKVFKKMNRNDLVQKLSDTSSGSKETLCG